MTDDQLLYLALAWAITATVVAFMAFRRGLACEERSQTLYGIAWEATDALAYAESLPSARMAAGAFAERLLALADYDPGDE